MILCGASDFSKSQPERTPRDRNPGEGGDFSREGSFESRKIPPNFNPSKSRVENRRRMGGEGGWERRIFAGTKETTAPSSFYSCKDILQEEELA